MKIIITIIAIILGYFLPNKILLTNYLYVLLIVFLIVGYSLKDLIIANSLFNKINEAKVNFNNKISYKEINSITLWIGNSFFIISFTSIIKNLFLNTQVNHIALIIGIFALSSIFSVLKLIK